jgi:hypothetical protein
MMSRYGTGRHRQAFIEIACPHCGQACSARRTLPTKPLYIRTHFDESGELCPPLRLGESRAVFVRPVDAGQLELFG